MNSMRCRLATRIIGSAILTLIAVAGVGSAQTPADGSLPQTLNEGFGNYVLVPAGSFLMGDNFGEGDGDEIPVHPV